MLRRTRRTILIISTPPRVPSLGEAHSCCGYSRPLGHAVGEEEVPMENIQVLDVPILKALIYLIMIELNRLMLSQGKVELPGQ